jgi:phosphinothricin acetyltransferase
MIRVADATDGAALAEIYRPFVDTTAISFESESPTAAEMTRRIVETRSGYPWLVLEDGHGKIRGYAYGHRFAARAAYRWSVETSIYVREGDHRQGVGRALYGALLDTLRLQGFRMALAGILVPHPPSVRFHESFGFQAVGTFAHVGWKLGAWRDVGWWQLDLGGRQDPPGEPVPFQELRPEQLVAAGIC